MVFLLKNEKKYILKKIQLIDMVDDQLHDQLRYRARYLSKSIEIDHFSNVLPALFLVEFFDFSCIT